eukprot:750035-Hanusia_phi.AAC.2
MIEIPALTLDQTLEGGEQIFADIARQLCLDENRLKLIHRGKVLNKSNISQVLHHDPQSVLQVVGTSREKLTKPLANRLMDWFLLPLHWMTSLLARMFPTQIFDNGFFHSALSFLRAAWSTMISFFISAMPGYVPPARDRDRVQEEEELGGRARVQRIIQTDGRRCRDEINMEMTDRFDHRPP